VRTANERHVQQVQPKVTVVIPCYNAERTVAHAIRSVLQQTVQDFEIVIVDDGSQDGTHQIACGFSGSRVRVLQHELNRGPAAARNTAFEAAKGEWVCVLDADDVLASDYLEVLLAYASDYPNAFLGSDIGCFFGNDETPRPWRTMFRCARAPIMSDMVIPGFASFINYGIDVKPFFPLQAMRKFAIQQEERAKGSEWLEFIAELYRAGLQLVLINRPIYYYRASGSNFSSRYEQVEEDIASCDRLLRAKWITEDVRQALTERRNRLRRHRPWKALHRKRFVQAIGSFVSCPGSLLHGISLARLELAKRVVRRSEGPASS
jgi:succinoglycan biosynthesis protein ExoO